ncbi:hypothetical protein R6231_21845, partial [Bacillus cytotoxicus]|uniref:hypothetical protein n=1 Tax=Bacillus cytotoxicus TaxID=580165 RepID=UPI002FE59A55
MSNLAKNYRGDKRNIYHSVERINILKKLLTISIWRCNIIRVADRNNAKRDKRNKKTWLTLKYK